VYWKPVAQSWGPGRAVIKLAQKPWVLKFTSFMTLRVFLNSSDYLAVETA
jgi:hypothetical protein